MPGRLHEGMTRTQSPARRGPRWSRAALLAFLSGLLVLALGWAMFSTTSGQDVQEAQAQVSRESTDSGERAQAEASSNSGARASAGGAEAYAAYDRKNPFAWGLDKAGDDDGVDDGDQNNGDDQVAQSTEDSEDNDGANQEAGQNGGDGDDIDSPTDNGTRASPAGDAPDAANGPSENVDCEGLQGLEKVICEDARDPADSTAADEENGAEPGDQQGDPGSGGSGRSGAGDPEEDFRNGGGGVTK